MSEEEKERILQTAQLYLDKFAEIAKAYYAAEDISRGAYLNVNVTLNSAPIFDAAWPSGKISYAFDGFPKEYKATMCSCMDEWEEGSNHMIKFSEAKSFNWWRNLWWNLGVLRVVKISKKNLKGASGQASPGYSLRPYLYIDKDYLKGDDYMLQTFRHELGHVIGLQHEFDRNDRSNYIEVADNHEWSDFSVPGIGRLFVSPIGSYDYNSVMNYYGFYHIKNSDGTRGAKIGLYDILEISEGDKKSVQYLYTYWRHW